MLERTTSYILNELSEVWFVVFINYVAGTQTVRRQETRRPEPLCESISRIREICTFGVGGCVGADGIKQTLNSRDNAATRGLASL